MITRWPIDCLNNKIIESLKVSLIKRFFNNLKCESNPQNDDLNYLIFDGDQRFITRWQTHCINDNTIERLNNISIVDFYKKKDKKNRSLVWCIHQLTIKTMHLIMWISKLITSISDEIFVWSLDNQYIVDSITT